jgi:hypothetical protein
MIWFVDDLARLVLRRRRHKGRGHSPGDIQKAIRRLAPDVTLLAVFRAVTELQAR